MKHTPGPWKIEVTQDAWGNDEFDIMDSGGYSLLTDFVHRKEDAKLMAAAPELLEDLESRYAQTRCGCGHPACNRCEDDRETERVLRKAKGGT